MQGHMLEETLALELIHLLIRLDAQCERKGKESDGSKYFTFFQRMALKWQTYKGKTAWREFKMIWAAEMISL